MLEIMAADLGATEIVLQDMIASRSDRLRSYQLLAEVFELSAGPADAGLVTGASGPAPGAPW